MEEGRKKYYWKHGPDLFFPLALITVGIIWLLVNNGTIPMENVYRLLAFWPVLLILAGLGIILRRIWWPLPGLLWLATAAFVVWVLVAAPSILPEPRGMEFVEEKFSEPLEGAESATVGLDLSINATEINPLAGSDNLIEGTIYHAGRLDFNVAGTEQKTITLDVSNNNPTNWLNWITPAVQNNRTWDIGLTTAVPVRLRVDASTGSTRADLTGMTLTALTVNASTGSMQITLPAQDERFPFNYDASTGSTTIVVPDGTAFDLSLEASTGSFTLDVPDNAGVQVEVRDGGPGGLNLGLGIEKVSGEAREDEGTYENAAYSTSANPIKIILDLSTGSFTVR